MERIKIFLKSHAELLNIVAFLYSFKCIIQNMILIASGTIHIKGAFLKNVKFKITGSNCRIVIGSRSRITNCSIIVKGDNTTIIIGGGKTIVSNTGFYVADNSSKIMIGYDFTMEGGHIAATEGKEIIIGNDCMFSNNIEIRNGDSHSIFSSLTKARINQAAKVSIGNHVWLCANVKIMKGTHIPENSIVGNNSLVSGKFTIPNAIYAGITAHIVKTDIFWDRKR